MTYLNEETTQQLNDFFKDIERDVTIVLFGKEGAETSDETKTLLTEITDLNEHLHLEVKDLEQDAELAEEYNVKLAPAFVLLDNEKNFTRMRFNGIPLGHEINSFLSALLEVGGNPPQMPEEMLERVKKIDKPVDIKVFVTLSCPHCPGAVQKAQALARVNPNIQAEMIEAQTFSELSEKYAVGSVPHVVFNDDSSFLGNQPFDEFIEYAEKAAN